MIFHCLLSPSRSPVAAALIVLVSAGCAVASEEKKGAIKVGEIVVLEAPSDATAPVAIADYPATLDELIKKSVDGDIEGIEQMLKEGRILAIDPGTKAKVVESKLLRVRVQLLEGPRKGIKGHLSREHVRRP